MRSHVLAAHAVEAVYGDDFPLLMVGICSAAKLVALGALALDLIVGAHADPNPDGLRVAHEVTSSCTLAKERSSPRLVHPRRSVPRTRRFQLCGPTQLFKILNVNLLP